MDVGQIEGIVVDEQDGDVFGKNDDIEDVVDVFDEKEHGEIDGDVVEDQDDIVGKNEDVMGISEEEFVDSFDDQNSRGLDMGELERMMRRLFQEHNESLDAYVKGMKIDNWEEQRRVFVRLQVSARL